MSILLQRSYLLIQNKSYGAFIMSEIKHDPSLNFYSLFSKRIVTNLFLKIKSVITGLIRDKMCSFI